MSGFDRSLGACALRRGVVVALFAVLAVVASGTHPEWASAARLCGDVDCSGNVSTSDALAFLQRAVGTVKLTDTALSGSFDGLLLSTVGIFTNRTETVLQFALDLESRCARSGALTVPYTLRTFVNDQEVTTTPGEYSAVSGPACGQVVIP